MKDIKTKDIRTWNANVEALRAIKGMPVPTNAKEYNDARNAVGEIVDKHLQNTPAKAKAPKAPKVPVAAKADTPRYDIDAIQRAMDAAIDPTMTLSEASQKRMDEFYNSFEYDNVGNWQNLPEEDNQK